MPLAFAPPPTAAFTQGAAISPDDGPTFLWRTDLRTQDVNRFFIWESISMVLDSRRSILSPPPLLRRLAGAFFLRRDMMYVARKL
jgi:hypothetical protein